MKNVFESVIKRGDYDLPDMLRKIDSYHIASKLSDQDRNELYALARGSANPTGNLNLLDKMLELEDRVRQLEDIQAEQYAPGLEPAEYTAGKWYRTGNQVTFEGAAYTCTVPEGMVCVWSPAEYPVYWEIINK